MVYNSDKVKNVLTSKGFLFKRDGGKHHKYYVLVDPNGKLTNITTHFSHNGEDIDDYLISRMSKQLRLSSGEFRKLIDCSIDYNKYINILKDKDEL
ncbi:MAG: type II toxin-antitoxin system HicA family toxin [Ignavibacteria bacterium]|nr:type II toxin-antitoxin system HicA family toxin [Ignavibacteria bacterium]